MFYYFQKYHSITSFNDIDQFQQNALHIAAASGFSDLAKYLIDSGDISMFLFFMIERTDSFFRVFSSVLNSNLKEVSSY